MSSTTKKYVDIKIQIPEKHYEAISKVALILECEPELLFQKSLNHALKTGTLGHIFEAMLNEKYHNVFNSPRNHHDLTL